MIIASKKYELEIILRDLQEKASTSSPAISKKFKDYTWEEIKEIAKSGKAEEIFEVGNEKTITLKNGEELTIAICGFNQDTDDKGNALPITLTTVNHLSNRYPMNSADTNKSGWKGCKMRRDTMDKIFTLLPDDLQSYIKTTNKGDTNDKLFLFNEIEIFGETVFSDDTFGKQYDYYKTKHNRNKYLNDENYSSWYWLRSPYSTNSTNFCVVDDVGNAGYGGASISSGVAFGFCI